MKIFNIKVDGKSYRVEVEEEKVSPAAMTKPKPVLPKSPPPPQPPVKSISQTRTPSTAHRSERFSGHG